MHTRAGSRSSASLIGTTRLRLVFGCQRSPATVLARTWINRVRQVRLSRGQPRGPLHGAARRRCTWPRSACMHRGRFRNDLELLAPPCRASGTGFGPDLRCRSTPAAGPRRTVRHGTGNPRARDCDGEQPVHDHTQGVGGLGRPATVRSRAHRDKAVDELGRDVFEQSAWTWASA